MYDIGSRIKALRLKNGLTLEELGSRTELTKGFLSLLERNLTSPSLTTLEDIVTKEDAFIDKQDGRTIYWIVPNAQKNRMEPLILELAPGESSKQIEPHEGEEFGSVLSGKSSLIRGNDARKLVVHKGENFYVKGNEAYTLINSSSAPARVLWISTPPIF